MTRAAARSARLPRAAPRLPGAAVRIARAVVRIGSAISVAGAAHAAINAALLRTAPPDIEGPAPPGDRVGPSRPGPEPPAAGGSADRTAPVRRAAVLIPARDEQDRIAACLDAVLAQRGTRALVGEVIVVDDESRDGTAAIVAGYGPRVRLVAGGPPPAGWLGKPAACARLAAAAAPECEVLVFVDADVLLAPDAVSRACALLDDLDLDLVSPYPRQVAGTTVERLVQPLLQWSWLTFLPLRLAERSSRPSLGAANGQFLAVRRSAYDRAGGHAAVRGDVLDDLALLRAIKAAGGHGTVVDGTPLASCRMYRGPAELADGYGKSLWAAFGSARGAAAVLAMLIVGYVLPPAAALAGSRAGAAGYLAAVGGRVLTARRTGGRAWPDAAAHPISILALAGLTSRSFALRRRGALRWAGRPIQPAGSARARARRSILSRLRTG